MQLKTHLFSLSESLLKCWQSRHLRPLLAFCAGVSLASMVACIDSNGGGSNGTSSNTEPFSTSQNASQNLVKTRYGYNNQCVVIQDAVSRGFVIQKGSGWAVGAEPQQSVDQAHAFFLKPSALGEYLLYTEGRQLLTADTNVSVSELSQANPLALWTLKVLGDKTAYPRQPQMGEEASPAEIAAYRNFKDPLIQGDVFELTSHDGRALAVSNSGFLTSSSSTPRGFKLARVPLARCAEFPEAQSNVVGESFSGSPLLGFADTHLHATSTTFLGGAKPGTPFHKFGVTHALENCDEDHGPTGQRDVVGSLFSGDVDGHSTQGWPVFTDWPSRTATTHEATYWKWIERAWKAGLRLTVNFAVDNQTLCRVQRNVSGDPTRNCNEMQSAKQQINTAWAMQDYIDAQYGGPGQGWWRVVTEPAQARDVMSQGKLAVLLGVEISNLLNCTVTFNPLNQQEGFEETAGGPTGQFYGCAMTETGAPNEILTQLKDLKNIGVSSLFTIHEFDNAFGGSDIFEGLVLNLGTRENSGGINNVLKGLGVAAATGAQAEALNRLEPLGLATGEFWTTHTCPDMNDPKVGSVFPSLGASMTNLGPPPPVCQYMGRGGRAGGKTACYPAEPQCNARTLTPIGLYTFAKVIEMGFIFEIDHLGYELKNQLLDLSAAQSPQYPTISGHGFSGLSLKQAERIYASGGLVYPTYNDTADLIKLWKILRAAWRNSGTTVPFAMGFGSDTNGLSPQAAPRANLDESRAVKYPFTLFKGQGFDNLPAFEGVEGLTFEQPATRSPDGRGRSWHVDNDGNAHYGMAADSVKELTFEALPEMLADLYGSASAYVDFWDRTRAASQSVARNGLKIPSKLLRPAPK